MQFWKSPSCPHLQDHGWHHGDEWSHCVGAVSLPVEPSCQMPFRAAPEAHQPLWVLSPRRKVRARPGKASWNVDKRPVHSLSSLCFQIHSLRLHRLLIQNRFCHRSLLQKTFLHGVIMSGFYWYVWFHYLLPPFHLCIQVWNVILHRYKVITSSP